MAAVWRPDAGLAVAHVERVPKLVALPVASQPGGTHIAMEGDAAILLAPGEFVTLPEAFVMAHSGDHFAALDAYRRIMAERGLAAPAIPEFELRADLVRLGIRAQLHARAGLRHARQGQGRRLRMGGARRRLAEVGRRLGGGHRQVPARQCRDQGLRGPHQELRHAAEAVDLAAVRSAGKRPDARASRHAAARCRRRRPERHLVEQLYALPGVPADGGLFQSRSPAASSANGASRA